MLNLVQKLEEIVRFSSLMYRSISLHVDFQVPLLLTPLYKLIIHCDGYLTRFILSVCGCSTRSGFKLDIMVNY